MKILHTGPVAKLEAVTSHVSLKPHTAVCRCRHGQTFKLSTMQSVRRSSVRCKPVVQPVQASVADQEVKSSDQLRFTHSVSRNSFEVKGDIKKVFTYAADFSHISSWDSGTTGSKLRESDSRPALKAGDTVALMTVLLGVTSSTVYQLLQIDTPKKVTFFGVSRFHESTDTVMFQQKPGAKDIVIVDYNTDIELVGWYRWFQPLLGFAMANLAKEAVEGMQKKLQQLQQQGEFAEEKATATAS